MLVATHMKSLYAESMYERSRKRVLVAQARCAKIIRLQEAEHRQAPHGQDLESTYAYPLTKYV